MTIKEARSILKKSTVEISDEELRNIVECFEIISELGFKNLEKANLKKIYK